MSAAKFTSLRLEDLCKTGSKSTSAGHPIRPYPDLRRCRAHQEQLWNEVKFIVRDPHWYKRRVKGAIHIRLRRVFFSMFFSMLYKVVLNFMSVEESSLYVTIQMKDHKQNFHMLLFSYSYFGSLFKAI